MGPYLDAWLGGLPGRFISVCVCDFDSKYVIMKLIHLWCNVAYVKSELYGAAIKDAEQAIAIDPSYIKGYYRRAVANMALGKFKG